MLGLLFSAFKKKPETLETKIMKVQKGDQKLRNEVLSDYKPFIGKTASTVCKRYISESEDEFSIGMIAFNEAIDKYSPDKGNSVLAFAEIIIKRRIIDYIRTQTKHREAPIQGMDEEFNEDYYDQQNSMEQFEKAIEVEKRKEEIVHYNLKLKEFGLTFQELTTHSPKHQDAREGAIRIAKILMADQQLKDLLFQHKRLPIKQLELKVDVSRKTIERNRKYIIAICIILNGDFLYLSEYIKGVSR